MKVSLVATASFQEDLPVPAAALIALTRGESCSAPDIAGFRCLLIVTTGSMEELRFRLVPMTPFRSDAPSPPQQDEFAVRHRDERSAD
jgi:hypothetical protein